MQNEHEGPGRAKHPLSRVPPRGSVSVMQAECASAGDKAVYSAAADAMECKNFSSDDARIWFDGVPAPIIHSQAFGSLRCELIERFGMEEARGFLTRMGYRAGTCAARMARKAQAEFDLKDMFVVCPPLYCFGATGLPKAVSLEFDVDRGTHHAEFIWTTTIEDEEPGRHVSIGHEPMCWMQIGYASGCSTEIMGRTILYREVECRSSGQSACRMVGRPLEEWDSKEVTRDLRFLPFEGLPATTVRAVRTPVPSLEGPMQRPLANGPVGVSAAFDAVSCMIERVAPTQATILLLGESGVGKEVFARVAHGRSPRADKPFVALNCAALPEQLAESELFGVERGAYSDATRSRAGRFERAHGGTLFLDEIGTLSPACQGKLLRALQEGEIERLGDTRTLRVDVRVIAATNVDLREEVKAGRFRADLYFRLNAFPIRIPSLRERREDIPLLMDHFLVKYRHRHGRSFPGFTQRAIDAMQSYDWPGNVRELENMVERGVILGTEDLAIDTPQLFTGGEMLRVGCYDAGQNNKLVTHESIGAAQGVDQEVDREALRACRRVNHLLLGGGGDDDSEAMPLHEIDMLLLKKAIERAKGNLAAAARLLGLTRQQVVYRLKARGALTSGPETS